MNLPRPDDREGIIWPRAIGHFDLDAFFASVEMLLDPSLADRPVIVGGDPDARGVVSTANYLARRAGVHSAMPARTARRLCPNAVFLRPRIPLYQEYSRQVFAIARDYSPVVQAVSIDEAYVDWSELADPVATAREFKERVRREIGLTVSVGLATGKVVAKIASDHTKPDGLTVVPPGTEAAFLAPLPARKLPGCGPKTAQRLAERGLLTIGDLAQADLTDLAAEVGAKLAVELSRRAQGIDDRPVETYREYKSISDETTFARDEADRRILWQTLREQAASCARNLQRKGLVARTVGVKLRYADFRTITRSQTLSQPTADLAALEAAVAALMRQTWSPDPRPLRLIGVRVANLQPAPPVPQLPLWSENALPS